jgi:hypothetical protein
VGVNIKQWMLPPINLVGKSELRWHFQTKRLGDLEIDD